MIETRRARPSGRALACWPSCVVWRIDLVYVSDDNRYMTATNEATRRYVTTIDHDSIFELVGDVTEPDSAIIAFLRMSHDSNVTVSDVRIERPLDNSLAWATLMFLSFTATPADVATLASRYSASDDDAPISYVDYLRLRS